MTRDVPTETDVDRPYVEYCLANVSSQSRAALENANVPTRGVACLDRCGRCYRSTFLVVDGKPIEGEACERLVDAQIAGDSE